MKVVLTIAGSDSSGGAGIQADLKSFESLGVFGTTAITVLTAQNTTGVSDIHEVPKNFVKAQLEAIKEDFEISAIKIGMLYSSQIMEVVEDFIKDLDIPIVLDPVFISKAGSPLLNEEAVNSMKRLFNYATLITPNQHEASKLFGYKHGDTDSLQKIQQSPCPVLVKHQVITSPNGSFSIDQLFIDGKKRIFKTEFIESTNLHGTGCSYSSAIAANLA
ncbi:MAG: bifunctional hydroxymethylpyrimidine kinase/phosphomethylpyrimidine kinase, partial [Campylobacterales bacterium]|nr:bifunctional hydroxymethylpyrimidine kinase/phosphomethylpyrimidine kinase [Campylobacterales bacterium]